VVTGAVGVAPFVPSSGHANGYIDETARRAKAQKKQGVLKEYTIAAYTKKGASVEGVKAFNTLEDAIASVATWIKNKLPGK